MKPHRFVFILTLLACWGGSKVLAASAVSGTGSTAATSASPASVLQGAVASLVVLAEEGQQLVTLRSQLQQNLDKARANLRANETAPVSADSSDAAKLEAANRHNALVRLVGNAMAVVAKFDVSTWPAFLARVNDAKVQLDAASRASTVTSDTRKRIVAAQTSLDASSTAIQNLQHPAPVKASGVPATNPPAAVRP